MTRTVVHLGTAVMLGTFLVLGGCSSSPTSRDAMEIVDDGGITARIKTALAEKDIGTLLDIEIESYRGVVQLNGFVDSEQTISAAGDIAAAVEGVESVQNNLKVKPAL